jgi:hypothetical protein
MPVKAEIHNGLRERKLFRYNMSLYYQATIVYFIFFIVYVVVKGQFIEDSFSLITKDPVIYFFTFVMIVAVFALLYNLILNRYIEIMDNMIIIKRGRKKREINFGDIKYIKIFREKRYSRSNPFRKIRIAMKTRRLPFTIRPYDYENAEKLIEIIKDIQNNLDK